MTFCKNGGILGHVNQASVVLLANASSCCVGCSLLMATGDNRGSRSVLFRYNLLFFVSGGGKFNYQGTKRWLEDNLDHTGTRAVPHHVHLDMSRPRPPP